MQKSIKLIASNIYHITTFLQGGAGKVLVDLAIHQKSVGNKVSVICSDKQIGHYSNYPDYIKKLRSHNISIFHIETFNRKVDRVENSSNELRHFFKNAPPSILHTHAGNPSRLSINSLKDINSNIPIIQTMHGWGKNKTETQEFQDISTLNKLSHIVFVSNSSLELLNKKGFRNPNYSVIYNGIEPTSVNEIQIDNTWIELINLSKRQNYLIFGIVGTLCELKNQKLVLEVANKIRDSIKIKFFFIGEGSHIKELRELCSKYHLCKQVHFLGYQENARAFIRNFDVLICPSQSEGLPISVIEAFAEETLVLASDIPEHLEIIKPNVNGLIFRNNDTNDLANKIINISKMKGVQSLKINASALFVQKFLFDETITKYQKLYTSLIS